MSDADDLREREKGAYYFTWSPESLDKRCVGKMRAGGAGHTA